jgi:phosphoribosylglycinamide formyltransferase-1
MLRKRVAVLVSGRGSNLKSLINASRASDYPAEIVLVISSKAEAAGVAVAREMGVPVRAIPHVCFESREAFDAEIDVALEAASVDIVCEAGFMRIHSDGFVRKWEGRMLNIHPSLLPAFKGIRVHQQALDAGVKISGCTVHFIVAELDSGPIIAQAAVPVLPGDTAQTLADRVLVEEHRIYPDALRLVASGRVVLRDGHAVFTQ